jgi:hypothetical protein
MQTWKDIVTTAVVGTEQQALALPQEGDALGSLLSQIGRDAREEALLNAASLVTLYRRAGVVPVTDTTETVEVSSVEERPLVSKEARQLLALLLDGQFKTVLPEWLKAVDTSQARVPEELLPELLDEGRFDSSIRELIVSVIGKRGEWLSKQNPDWKYATPGAGEEVWETGSREQRLLLLDALRGCDASAARQMLASTWQQESAKDRTAFLEKFAAGLTYEDEEFLNSALQDRSGDVRRSARDILSRLPNATFTKRVKKLTSDFLTFKKPLLGKARIEASVPDEPVEWLKQNEIEIDSPPRSSKSQAFGPKAWCLKEIVALTPLSHWVELWQKTPRDIVNAAFEGEWAMAFSEGLVRAARRDLDPEWIEALLKHWIHDMKSEVNYSSPIDLAAYLPGARLESLILTLMKTVSKGMNDTHPVLQILLAHPGQWSDELSRLVIASIKIRIPRIQKDETIDWQTRAALKKFAHHIAPDLYDELALGWPMEAEAWPSWSKAVDEFQSVLAFRRDMYRAIFKKDTNS